MNLFENILKNVNPQAKQVFSQTGQALKQSFQPLTQISQQITQPVSTIGTGIIQWAKQAGSGIVEPIKKEFEYQSNVRKAIEPYKKQIQSLGITAQTLDSMGFSEEEKQAIKDIYSELGETIPGLEEQQKVQAQQGEDLGFFGSIGEGLVGASRVGGQIPRYTGNLLNLTQKYVTTPLIAGGAEALGADEFAQKWRSAGEKFGAGSQALGEAVTRAGEGDITEKQRNARRFGASMVATAPIPLGTATNIVKGTGLGATALRGAIAGGAATPINTGLEEGRLPTGGEMATGIAGGAVLGPVAEKIVAPAVAGIANKTGKYGTALVKGGTEGLKKSVSRDLSGIPKAIQGKAEAISTRANRFNALDEEKFTKQIGETPGQFAVSRGMTDVGDDAIVKANQNYQKSLQEADKSIGAIEGKFSTKGQKDDILGELVGANKAKMELQPRNPDANKARQLFNKYESGEGLTMSEINEAKRIYQRNHTYTYEQLASNEARNSKYLQDGVREWQFKTAKENGLTNIADINKTTKAWKMWADSLAKKVNRSQANNEFGITDWIALSGGTPENIALFLGKKALSSKYVKSGIIKTLGKQTKPSIIEGTNAGVQQANFQKNVNRGISNNRGDVGGKSMVRVKGLLPAGSKEAIKEQEEAIARQQAKKLSTEQAKKRIKAEEARKEAIKTPDITSRSKVRPSVKPSPKVKPVEKTVKAKNLTPKKQSATMNDMETKKLIEEARKYKSAEEFEKSLRSPRGIGYGGNMGILWRATSKPYKPDTKTIIEHGITDSGNTKSYAKDILLSNDYGKSEPYIISKDAKIASWSEGNDVYKTTKESAFSKKSIEEFKRRGFDGFSRGPDEIVIFNHEKINPFNIKDFFRNYIKNERIQKGYKSILKSKTTNAKQQVIKPDAGDTIPEGYFRNTFGEIVKKPSNKTGGFIRLPFTSKLNVKPKPKQLFAGENAKAPPKGKTGWFRGADGKMRFEIDDSGAKINMDGAYKVYKWAEGLNLFSKEFKPKGLYDDRVTSEKLSDIIIHDELFKQYPELKDMKVFLSLKRKKGAAYFENNNTIEIPMESIYKIGGLEGDVKTINDNIKSEILHEIQHAIQNKEGFAKGGSTQDYRYAIRSLEQKLDSNVYSKEQKAVFKSELDKLNEQNGYDYYRSLAGEVEARNVQTRMGMSPTERVIKRPESTEDVPRSKQIVRMDIKGPAMSKKLTESMGDMETKKLINTSLIKDEYKKRLRDMFVNKKDGEKLGTVIQVIQNKELLDMMPESVKYMDIWVDSKYLDNLGKQTGGSVIAAYKKGKGNFPGAINVRANVTHKELAEEILHAIRFNKGRSMNKPEGYDKVQSIYENSIFEKTAKKGAEYFGK